MDYVEGKRVFILNKRGQIADMDEFSKNSVTKPFILKTNLKTPRILQ